MDSNKFEYLLRLGDSSLILGQRLSEWCGHGPVLEEDIALTNIALDLIGQARSLLTYAGEIEGKGKSEDDLAYFRDVMDYRNVLLCELPNGHFGDTIVRQFFFDHFQYLLYQQLSESNDEQIKAIAIKSLKEVTYHRKHISEWIIRLGDGTDESQGKVQQSVNDLWSYTGEMFTPDKVDIAAHEAGYAADLSRIKEEWLHNVSEVISEATLTLPPADAWMQKGGKKGRHTEHLGFMLAEMQSLPRMYPTAKW